MCKDSRLLPPRHRQIGFAGVQQSGIGEQSEVVQRNPLNRKISEKKSPHLRKTILIDSVHNQNKAQKKPHEDNSRGYITPPVGLEPTITARGT